MSGRFPIGVDPISDDGPYVTRCTCGKSFTRPAPQMAAHAMRVHLNLSGADHADAVANAVRSRAAAPPARPARRWRLRA